MSDMNLVHWYELYISLAKGPVSQHTDLTIIIMQINRTSYLYPYDNGENGPLNSAACCGCFSRSVY